MKVARSLIVAIVNYQSIGSARVAVFNGFGVLKYQRAQILIKRIQNSGSIGLVPSLITEVMSQVNYGNLGNRIGQIFAHLSGFYLCGGEIFC